MEDKDFIKKLFTDQGFYLNDKHLEQFDIYRRELKEWNTRINLTSLTEDIDIIYKHFIDSLLIICYCNIEDKAKVADVGTGAGFPGIPIKIYRPDIRLWLFESVGKKTVFLDHVVTKLGLENISIINDRVEKAARLPEYREQFDLVVARAVAKLSVLVEYCLPLVALGGTFVAYKGFDVKLELEDAQFAIETLGVKLCKVEYAKIIHSTREEYAQRALIFIDKVKKTSDNYPRRSGIPEKKPLLCQK